MCILVTFFLFNCIPTNSLFLFFLFIYISFLFQISHRILLLSYSILPASFSFLFSFKILFSPFLHLVLVSYSFPSILSKSFSFLYSAHILFLFLIILFLSTFINHCLFSVVITVIAIFLQFYSSCFTIFKISNFRLICPSYSILLSSYICLFEFEFLFFPFLCLGIRVRILFLTLLFLPSPLKIIFLV